MRWPWTPDKRLAALEQEVVALQQEVEDRRPSRGVKAPFWRDVYQQLEQHIGPIPQIDPVTSGHQSKVGAYYRHPWGEYKEMVERDPVISACLQQRQNNVLSRNRVIRPGAGNKRKAEFAANYVRHVLLERFPLNAQDAGLVQDLRDLLMGVPMGIAIMEAVWDTESFAVPTADGESKPAREWFNPQYLSACDPRTFGFNREGRLLIFNQDHPEGELAEERKFIIFRPYAMYSEPFGTPLLRPLFFYSWYKRMVGYFWLAHCEKYGEPTVYSEKPDAFRTGEKEALLTQLEDIQRRTAIVPPGGVKLHLLEAADKSENYRELLAYIDKQICLTLIGQTTTVIGDNNSTGSSEVHERMAFSIQAMDAAYLEMIINSTIIPWMMEFNLPGYPVPHFEIVTETPKSQLELIENVLAMAGTNYRVSIRGAADLIGLKQAESDEDVLQLLPAPYVDKPSDEPKAERDQKAKEREKAKPASDEPRPTP